MIYKQSQTRTSVDFGYLLLSLPAIAMYKYMFIYKTKQNSIHAGGTHSAKPHLVIHIHARIAHKYNSYIKLTCAK